LKDKDENYGNVVRGTCVKNKVAPPFRKGEFEIHYGKGISRAADIINIGVEERIIKKSGSWFSYEDARLGQGKPAAVEFLEGNKNMAQEIEEMIISLKCPWLRREDGGDST
jgi:recombination protein RecA